MKNQFTSKEWVGKTETVLVETANNAAFLPPSFHPKAVIGISSASLITFYKIRNINIHINI